MQNVEQFSAEIVQASKVGLNQDRLNRLKNTIETDVGKGTYDGAVFLVARHGKIAMHEAVGKTDLANDRQANINDIFGQPLAVINIGLDSLDQSVRDQDVPVVNVDWRPPAEGVPRLLQTRTGVDIDQANEEVCQRIKQARPVLAGMGICLVFFMWP